MKKFIEKLDKYEITESYFFEKRKFALILSGQNNFSHSELSDEQKKFIKTFEKYGYTVIEKGFPYNKSFDNNNYEIVNNFILDSASNSRINYSAN